MVPMPLKLTEEPHWKANALFLEVRTIHPLIENTFRLEVCGPGALQMAPHLQMNDLLLLFSPAKTSLALRYSANNRLHIITSDEETKIDIEQSDLRMT